MCLRCHARQSTTASETASSQTVVEQPQLHFGTGRWSHDFSVQRPTRSGRQRQFAAAPGSCRSRSNRSKASRRGTGVKLGKPTHQARPPSLRQRGHRTNRTRGHDTCPSAAASMRRSRRSSGSQEPPRATKRLAASTIGPPVSATGREDSNRASRRASCWVFSRSTSSKPSAPMSRTEKVQRTIRDGLPSTTSTTMLACRTRCPAKSGTRATSSRRSIRMKALLASACSLSSAESRNNLDDRPIASAVRLSRGSAGGRAGPRSCPASSKCAPRCGTSGNATLWRRRWPGQLRPHSSCT
jgi:hypothetical protein